MESPLVSQTKPLAAPENILDGMMNVPKQYNRTALVNFFGVAAMCVPASPVIAQSGFVPIGKPQTRVTGGTLQKQVVPATTAPENGRVELRSSGSLRPLGASNFGGKPAPLEQNRPSFGGINYGASSNSNGGSANANRTAPSPNTRTPFKTTGAPQSFGQSPTSPMPRSFGDVNGNGSSSSSTQARIDVDHCSVHLIDDIEIPAKESGLLSELNVKEGDAVPANKIIGTIDATLLQIELQRAQTKLEIANEMASDTSSIEVAMKKYALAKHEYEVASRLASKGSKSNQERMRAKYSKDASAAEVTVAKMQQREALGQARIEDVNTKQIQQMISNLRVETRFDGQVLQLFKHPGEWVNKGDSIAHFARIDHVWVEGTVSADKCNIQDVMGQDTIVTLKQAGGETVTFNGKIVSIPLKMEAAGSRFRVKAEVLNRFENGAWLLRPEAQLSMKIDLSPNTAKRNASRMNR